MRNYYRISVLFFSGYLSFIFKTSVLLFVCVHMRIIRANGCLHWVSVTEQYVQPILEVLEETYPGTASGCADSAHIFHTFCFGSNYCLLWKLVVNSQY